MSEVPEKCPVCGTEHSPEAVRCLECGYVFPKKPLSENSETGVETDAESDTESESLSEAGFTVNPGLSDSELFGGILADSAVVEELNEDKDKLELIGEYLGEYKVTGLIGEGGMGTVYSGVHPLIGKKVAFKLLHRFLTEDKRMTERFLAEAKAVNAIAHPNIIDIFAFGEYKDGGRYFVMEYLEGTDFDGYLEEHEILSYKTAYSVFSQLLSALKASHQKGVIHRDLKPDNIFLVKRPSNPVYVKVLDFGLAKFSERGFKTTRTKSGVPIGTSYYMSPEQCLGKDVDHRTDIYALGVILYESFTGRRPFRGDSFMEVLNKHISEEPVAPGNYVKIDPELEEIILQCLQKERDDRPADIEELEKRLIPRLKYLSENFEAPEPLDRAESSDTGKNKRRKNEKIKIVLSGLFFILFSLIFLFLISEKPGKIREFNDYSPRKTLVVPEVKPESASAGKKVRFVTLKIEGIKNIKNVEIKLDGKKIRETAKVKVDGKKKVLSIKADGFEGWKKEFIPRKDTVFNVVLLPKSKSEVKNSVKVKKTDKKSKIRRKKHPGMRKNKKKTLLDIGLI